MKPMMACGHAANATNSKTEEPCCAICVGIHEGAETVVPGPDLTGRIAKCTCGRTRPSSEKLAFFEYRGPGSPVATETCKCGYHKKAHDPEYMKQNVPSNRETVIEQGKCKGFEPRGPMEYDSFYCGHSGWD